MNIDNDSSIYGECRCCLAKGNHRHITREYSHNGVREVYIEMFLDCMNLFLLTDPRLPPLICSHCVDRLRDVHSFRTLVASTEQKLIDTFNNEAIYVNEMSSNEVDFKEDMKNVKTEEQFDDNNDTEFMAENKNELKTEADCITTYFPDMDTYFDDTIIKAHKRKRRKTESKPRRKKYDSESDTPIAQIKLKKEKRISKICNNSDERKTKPSQSKQESIKDNNNLRSNIMLILKHSTILPFKNNFKTHYNCFYCEKNYILFKDLREHIEMSHRAVCENTIDKCLRSMQDLILSADISCIKCKLCDTELKTIEHLIDHLCNTHEKMLHETIRKPSHGILGYDMSSENLKCHICSKEFAFFKNLTIHMNEHFGLFVCYVCGKKFLSEHRLKCHVFNHHESKDTKCKHCGEIFKTEASMAYHVKKEHLKRTIKCPKCPQTFAFTKYISRLNHMADVHGIKKPIFKCDTCSKEYANSGSLAAHKRYTHKRTNEHRCDICGYITVHNTVMKNHMDVHNGVKNYECEFCKKKFAKPYTLKLHLKIHLNDKRFVCTLCDAAFIQKNSLKNHLKARHPDSGVNINKLS